MTSEQTQDRKPDFFDIPPDDPFLWGGNMPFGIEAEQEETTVSRLRREVEAIRARHEARRAGK